jgi:hypothetical protein
MNLLDLRLRGNDNNGRENDPTFTGMTVSACAIPMYIGTHSTTAYPAVKV